jgi:hypothetical protein
MHFNGLMGLKNGVFGRKQEKNGGNKMERSLEVMKEIAFQFDGDLVAKVFGYEIDAQSIVSDYKWMISQIEKYEKALNEIKKDAVYYDNKGWALNPDKVIKIVDKAI